MSKYADKNYTDFFKEEIYGRFSSHLIAEYGANAVILLLRGQQLVTKKGVNNHFQRDFTKFLSLNPEIQKEFAKNRNRFMSLRNIAGGDLAFQIDPEDDELMIREGLRTSKVIPTHDDIRRATKEMKRSAKPMTGQVVKSERQGRGYLLPKRLTVHFKSGYATKIGKTTLTFTVNSRSEAVMIIIDRFENKVAYATIQGEEEFCLVKPRNGKTKRNRKLRGQVQ